MMDQTTTAQIGRPSRLQLPMQAAPVHRSPATGAAISSAGVEADDVGQVVGDVAKAISTVAPFLFSLFSDRALKRDITPVSWSR